MAKPYWGLLVLTVAALIGVSAVSLVTPEMVRRLTAMLTEGTATKERVITYAVILLAAYVAKAFLTFISKFKAHEAAWKFVGDLMLRVYGKLQTLSMRYFGDKQTGEIMSRVINDSRNMETLIAHALPDLFSNILIVIMVTIMIFTINPILAALSLIPVPAPDDLAGYLSGVFCNYHVDHYFHSHCCLWFHDSLAVDDFPVRFSPDLPCGGHPELHAPFSVQYTRSTSYMLPVHFLIYKSHYVLHQRYL